MRGVGYKVVLEDERFTSAEAKSALRKGGRTEKQMRGRLDVVAAQVILQDYLNEHFNAPEA
jgi:putative Holliday junction resolvase